MGTSAGVKGGTSSFDSLLSAEGGMGGYSVGSKGGTGGSGGGSYGNQGKAGNGGSNGGSGGGASYQYQTDDGGWAWATSTGARWCCRAPS